MKGGLKKKNDSLTSWQAVYKMIGVPKAQLNIISYNSLKGFIFRLDVPPDPQNSEFFGLNDSLTFDKEVYSLVFKMSILSNHSTKLPTLEMKTKKYKKNTDNLDSFKKEAFFQQKIYTQTLLPTGDPITISVVDFSYFDKDASIKLLTRLLSIPSNDEVQKLLKYLISCLNGFFQYKFRLGMITMELIDTTFDKIGSIDPPIFDYDCNYVIAQLLILFTRLKIINYDCHYENVLASVDEPEPKTLYGRYEKRSVLIDFGRIIDVNDVDSFFDDDETRLILKTYNDLTKHTMNDSLIKIENIKDIDLISGKTRYDIQHIENMHNIIKFISTMDYCINHTLFGIDSPQITFLLTHIYGVSFDVDWSIMPDWEFGWSLNDRAISIYKNVSPVIQAIRSVPLDQKRHDDITEFIESGKIFSINKSISSYDRSSINSWFSTPENLIRCSLNGMCVGIGAAAGLAASQFGFDDISSAGIGATSGYVSSLVTKKMFPHYAGTKRKRKRKSIKRQ